MRHPELRPSVSHRSDERPPPGVVSAAAIAVVAVVALAALSPLLAAAGVFAGSACLVTARAEMER